MTVAYPLAPGSWGTDTSIAAADSMLPHAARVQRLALDAIRKAGARGLTSEELAAALRMDRTTVQPRTSELRALRRIVDSGQRRPNASGKRAIVWMAREDAA